MPDRTRRRTARAVPRPELPEGLVRIDTGTAELRRDASDPSAVTVMVNGVPSSHLDLDDPTWLEFEYMQQMAAVVAELPPGPLDAVHLGAAACAFPRALEAVRPGSRQLAVDVDAALLTLVRTWFDLPRAPRLRLRPGEARSVLSSLPTASADLVVRDVFAPDATPEHLTTVEFLIEVRRVLRPGGLYLANCADRPPLDVVRAEVAGVREVLDGALLVAEPGQLRGRRYGNLVVGGQAPPATVGLSAGAVARRLRSLPVPARFVAGEDLTAFVGAARPRHDTATSPPGPATPGPGPTAPPNGPAAPVG